MNNLAANTYPLNNIFSPPNYEWHGEQKKGKHLPRHPPLPLAGSPSASLIYIYFTVNTLTFSPSVSALLLCTTTSSPAASPSDTSI